MSEAKKLRGIGQREEMSIVVEKELSTADDKWVKGRVLDEGRFGRVRSKGRTKGCFTSGMIHLRNERF